MNPVHPTAALRPDETPEHLEALALSSFFDGSPVPKFVIDTNHIVTHWNKACERITGKSAAEMVGAARQWEPFYSAPRPTLADLVISGTNEDEFKRHYGDKVWRSTLIPGAYECEDFFPGLADEGRWLLFSAAPLRDPSGHVVGAIETLQDVTKRKLAEQALQKSQVELEHLVQKRTAELAHANARLEEDIHKREATESELLRRNAELTELNAKLSQAQEQLMQSEKLASIGQLAAGVAHEINNPIGYIFSNFGTLEQYIASLFAMLSAYEESEASIANPTVKSGLAALKAQLEIDYLKDDIPHLMTESREGIVRVRKIVQDLKDFSRVGADKDWQWADLHQGINSTLNIVTNEVKYKADVVKEYGDIPEVECLPSQINQVVMNIIVNAAHAMGETRGKITLRTGRADDQVWIEITDTGTGIPGDILPRIFDPFFTTKPVGKGTGLGLSLAYGIVRKHHGRIDVESTPGVGTTFRVNLPIRHPHSDSDNGGTSQ